MEGVREARERDLDGGDKGGWRERERERFGWRG